MARGLPRTDGGRGPRGHDGRGGAGGGTFRGRADGGTLLGRAFRIRRAGTGRTVVGSGWAVLGTRRTVLGAVVRVRLRAVAGFVARRDAVRDAHRPALGVHARPAGPRRILRRTRTATPSAPPPPNASGSPSPSAGSPRPDDEQSPLAGLPAGEGRQRPGRQLTPREIARADDAIEAEENQSTATDPDAVPAVTPDASMSPGAGRLARQALDGQAVQQVKEMSLGVGICLVGLGLGFLALRMRRAD